MTCTHPTLLKATNVSAILEKAYLRGGPGNPMQYDEIVYCSNPCCERVFKARLTK